MSKLPTARCRVPISDPGSGPDLDRWVGTRPQRAVQSCQRHRGKKKKRRQHSHWGNRHRLQESGHSGEEIRRSEVWASPGIQALTSFLVGVSFSNPDKLEDGQGCGTEAAPRLMPSSHAGPHFMPLVGKLDLWVPLTQQYPQTTGFVLGTVN